MVSIIDIDNANEERKTLNGNNYKTPIPNFKNKKSLEKEGSH